MRYKYKAEAGKRNKKLIQKMDIALPDYWLPQESKFIDKDIIKEIEGKSIMVSDVIVLQLIKSLKKFNKRFKK